VEGTTGYEFAAAAVGLFIEPAGAQRLLTATAEATGDRRGFAERAVDAKRRVVDALFPHDLGRVSRLLRNAMTAVEGMDVHDPAAVADAVAALTAALEVYRTYRRPGDAALPEDLKRIERAASAARHVLDRHATSALDDLAGVLSSDLAPDGAGWRAVAAWQQFSGPLAAKGVEDTALYDVGGLLAVADVGADPDHPHRTPDQFHEFVRHRAARTPLAMNSTSTHDSKRGLDVRCRLAVLSEIPEEWNAVVVAVDGLATAGESAGVETAMRRYLYETAVGAWPLDGDQRRFATRLRDHSLKAAREAKRQTSWTDPDPGYEERLAAFAQWLASDDRATELLTSAVADVGAAGASNAIAAVLLKATVPGVPDVYQSDDSWSLTLVDPDNREPLDAAAHRRLLHDLPSDESLASGGGASVGELVDRWQDGRVKQLVVRQALRARRELPELFALGSYRPLAVTGSEAERVVGFARSHGGAWAITVVPRLVHGLAGRGRFALGGCWGDTAVLMPPHCPPRLVDRLTGRTVDAADGLVSLAHLLDALPVALLTTG
jgi:(1->4)-alpha-D-glucan 1-alpha-D-glucosylmutase